MCIIRVYNSGQIFFIPLVHWTNDVQIFVVQKNIKVNNKISLKNREIV